MRAKRLLAPALLLALTGAPPLAAAAPPGAARADAAPADAAPQQVARDSFLFARRVLDQIEAARAGDRPVSAPVVGAAPPAPAGSIHLAAIVYHGPDDWRIWLNGQSFTPAARPRAIEILQVTAEAVVLAWRTGPGAPPTRVELQPNQSYLVASGRIIEGRVGARP